MIAIGIIGLCLVAGLWVLLYFYFIRRTDRFMENWEKDIKEKAEKATQESLQSLQEAAKSLEVSVEGIQSIQEAAEAIKASRKAMEQLAYERSFIPKPPAEEILIPEQTTEPLLESMLNPSPVYQFTRKGARKHKEWGNWTQSLADLPAY